MRTMSAKTILCCVVPLVALLSSCATETAPLRIEKGLPPERLARYQDSFDKLRDDLWEVVGYIRKADVRTNFRLGDTRVQDGQLKMTTKTECFSTSALVPKFLFRGDFDIQIDCHVEFLNDVSDMDQVVSLIAADRTTEMEDEKLENVSIGLLKRGNNPGGIFSARTEKGRWRRLGWSEINRFRGTLRIARIGENFTALCRNEGESEWRKMSTTRYTNHDIFIKLSVTNYDMIRGIIGAKRSFSASFDNFRINAAQKIIESDI